MLCLYSHRSNVSSCAKGVLSAQKTLSHHTKKSFPLLPFSLLFPSMNTNLLVSPKPHLAFPTLLPPIPGFNHFLKCVEQPFDLSSPATTLTSLRVL